ncbi:hypothetical protein CK203_042088 [Vitis vinifera]|uniref:Uncharacterized protein n=1 Tax=Vitis vinifera TaxID=29760 RepID=A0A438HHQ9_VITVI|nr:hypothetical protein CK203_042088 [Vitis vinifera]
MIFCENISEIAPFFNPWIYKRDEVGLEAAHLIPISNTFSIILDPTRVKKSVAMEKGLAQLLGQKPAMEVGGLSRNGEKRMKRKDILEKKKAVDEAMKAASSVKDPLVSFSPFCHYDTIVMGMMGVGEKWLRWMQWCISTASFSVLGHLQLVPLGGVENAEALAADLGCKVGSLPSSYLGLPLGAPHRSVAVWDGVEERFKKKLAGLVLFFFTKFWWVVSSGKFSSKDCFPNLFNLAAQTFPSLLINGMEWNGMSAWIH